MAREYGVIRPSITKRTELAEAGLVAAVLYLQGRSRCDNYGRLEASPQCLATEVLPNWVLVGKVTLEEIQEAKEALIRVGLWHRYYVGGREYIEYEGYDAEQQPSYLSRRGAQPTYPDPPDRPELWAANRPHLIGKREQGKQKEPSAAPDGSTDLSPVGSTGVPSPAVQGTVPVEAQADESSSASEQAGIGDSEGFAQLARCHEQYSGRMLSTDDQVKLRAVLADAQEAGVEWQTLLAIMREVQRNYKPTRTEPVIKSIAYYLPKWNQHIRQARAESERLPQSVNDFDDGPPPEDDDPIARRAREQLRRLVAGHAAT